MNSGLPAIGCDREEREGAEGSARLGGVVVQGSEGKTDGGQRRTEVELATWVRER